MGTTLGPRGGVTTTGSTCSILAGTPSRNRLGYYGQQFDTVELNASFYRWPRDASFASWRRRLPDGFVFSVKAPRGLTHGKRLYAPETWVGRISPAWHELGDRRGVLLVQLPPGMERDDGRLAYFLDLLPEWMKVAVEFRHHSWHDESVFELLEEHQTAYCVMSGAGVALRPPCHGAVCLCQDAWAGPPPPLRRVVLRAGPALVGGPDFGVGGRRQGSFRLFQ